MKSLRGAVAIASISLFSSALGAEPTAAGAAVDYSLTSTIAIGGEGRWDYIAFGSEDHKLYITRSTHVDVIDPVRGKVVADITGGEGLHGTAIVPTAGRGFITDGKAAKLLVFDLKTDKMLGTIDAADDADGIIYDKGIDRILVSCGDAGEMLVLDPHADVGSAKGKVDKVELDGKPEFLAADEKGRAFVCLNDKNTIGVVDLNTLKVTERWPCGTGTAPTGLAIDEKSGHLFVGCRNQKLIVMSATDGKVLSELPIGKGNDACGFNPTTGEAFASCGDGTLTVVGETSPGNFAIKQTVETRAGARTMTIDPSTQTIYLPTATFAATQPSGRPAVLPGSFVVLVVKLATAAR